MPFIDHFISITDPRKDINKRHNLLDIIFLTLAAYVSGSEGWQSIEEFGQAKEGWLKQYRSFENGIPSHDTIAR